MVSVLFPSLLFSVLPFSFPISLSSVQSVFAEFVVVISFKFWWALVPRGLPKLYEGEQAVVVGVQPSIATASAQALRGEQSGSTSVAFSTLSSSTVR